MASKQLSNLLALPPTIRSSLFQTLSRSTTTSCLHARQHSTNGSVNQTEVHHFNQLASSWWDPHGSSRLLHLMNPLRHQFIRKCTAAEPSIPARYLDIGCGGGIFAESAARLSTTTSVTAIDPTPEVIAVARRHQRHDPLLLQPGRLTYLNTPIEYLHQHIPPTLDGDGGDKFDIITLFEVVEHIQRPSPFLQTVLEHLKPGGWLIGSTIARTSVSWFTTKFVAEDVMGIVPKGTHDWDQYIQPTELQNWARAQPGLTAADGYGWQVMGVVYVPGLGWKEVGGSEAWGNYFFGMRKRD